MHCSLGDYGGFHAANFIIQPHFLRSVSTLHSLHTSHVLFRWSLQLQQSRAAYLELRLLCTESFTALSSGQKHELLLCRHFGSCRCAAVRDTGASEVAVGAHAL